jgi:hypothetical protein
LSSKRSRRVPPLRALLSHSVVLVSALVLLVTGGARAAASGSSATPSTAPGRSIAVSVPADPVPFKPGQTEVVKLRVVNPGTRPVRVTITGTGLTLGDEGKVTVTNSPDPLWADNAHFPSGPYRIPANSYKDLAVRVHAPDSLKPDLYFLGFIVTPIPDANSGVTVINQIGGYFTIDIPGPRDRRLTADLELPGFSLFGLHMYIGKQVDGTLNVHNIGTAAVQFWGETDTKSTLSNKTTQARIPVSLAPAGHVRTFVVVGKPAWPIGFVHMKVVIIYATRTESTTQEILFTRSIFVVSPWVFVALVLIMVVLAYRRVRKSQLKRRAAAQASRKKAAAPQGGIRQTIDAMMSALRSGFSRLPLRRGT